MILFHSSSLEDFVPRRHYLRMLNKWKSEEVGSGLKGAFGSCSRPNWTMVSTVLPVIWDHRLSCWNLSAADLRKGSFVCCTHRNPDLFQNVLYCNSFISQNEYINWIHHFRCSCNCKPAKPVSTWILFQSSFNNLSYFYICFSY